MTLVSESRPVSDKLVPSQFIFTGIETQAAELRGEAEGAWVGGAVPVDAAALPPTGSRVQAAEQLYYPLLSVTEAAKLQRDVRSTQRRALHMPRQSSRGFG